jgi:hypothetical protein
MATKDDSPEIVTLMNATFRTPIDVPTWEWYVYGNPFGTSRIYLALEPEADNIAGAVGFNPIPLRIGSGHVMGDYAHHLAIKHVYRDTTSYMALMRYAMKGQASGATTLTIGPPNRTAYPIHKGLMQWRDFGFLDCMRKLSPQAQPHSCQEIKCFPPEFDLFYERVSKHFTFCVEKSTEWVNWRFCRRPNSVYTIYASRDREGAFTGYVVLKPWREPDGHRKAHILDLHGVDDAALSQLLAAAHSYAAGFDELNLWAIQGYPYRPLLETMGFSPGFRQPLLLRSYDNVVVPFPGGDCSLMYGDGDTQY